MNNNIPALPLDFALADANRAAILALERGKHYYTATYEQQLAFHHWRPTD